MPKTWCVVTSAGSAALAQVSLARQPSASFAVSLLKQKVAAGDIKSQAGIQKWESTLGRLIGGTLGDFYIEAIEARDVMRWRGEQAKLVQSQTYSPHTINTDLSVLKVILKHARIELGLSANAAADIPSLDVSQHRPYSREEPNALTAPELQEFLASFARNSRSTLRWPLRASRRGCVLRPFGRFSGRGRRRTCCGTRASCWCAVRTPEAMSR